MRWPRWTRFATGLLAALSPLYAHGATLVVPTQFATIQAAIDQAQPLDVVVVEPGTYSENLALRSQVDVIGRETARTLLEPQSKQLPAARIRTVNDVRFSGFTVVGAATGVEVAASSNVEITNVVFESVDGIALDAADSQVHVANNVFFGSVLAIRRNTIAVTVENNIFRSNDVTIGSVALLVNNNANVDANCWSNNADLRPGGIDGSYGTRATLGDPLFVAETGGDFHLKEGSPCIDAGVGTDAIDSTTADAGAHGGPFADALPMPVSGLALTDASAVGAPGIAASWIANASYLVSHSTVPGGYRVYYAQNHPGPPYDGTDAGGGTQASPLDVGNVTTATLASLAAVRPAASPAQLLTAAAHDQAVVLTWQPVEGAAGYRVHYGVDSTAEHQVDAGNVAAYTVTGLTNGSVYRFTVGTLTRATYYVAVTARDSTPQRHESVLSEERSIQVGDALEAPVSNELTARPELTVAYPVLPDEGGCFIATAAYGADWFAEVLALRDFRDRYLLPHAVGRWLVARYYDLSPGAADWIREHPRTKPLVRGLLTPLVVVALFLLGSTAATKSAIAVLLAALVVLDLARRRRKRVHET